MIIVSISPLPVNILLLCSCFKLGINLTFTCLGEPAQHRHQGPEAQDHLPDRGHRVGRGAGRREERPARDRGPAPRQRHLQEVRPAVCREAGGRDNPRPLQRHQLHLQQRKAKKGLFAHIRTLSFGFVRI